MKDIKELIIESNQNSIPWSESAAHILTLWTIANNNDNKILKDLWDQFTKDQQNNIYALLKRMNGKEFYIDNLLDTLRSLDLKIQSKGIKFNSTNN